ncbi:tetratricopeptide repeat protein [Vreelandella andesensis]|nr:tetratricopeptide repeat protein [Halomonas andesensis]
MESLKNILLKIYISLTSFNRYTSEEYGHKAYNNKNYELAADMLFIPAENGDIQSQITLGIMYENGQGVPQNHAEAAKWYKKAAVQGSSNGQFYLSLLYKSGLGVPFSPTMAYVLESLSAAQGHKIACKNRNLSLEKLERNQVSEGQKITLSWHVGEDFPTCSDFNHFEE